MCALGYGYKTANLERISSGRVRSPQLHHRYLFILIKLKRGQRSSVYTADQTFQRFRTWLGQNKAVSNISKIKCEVYISNITLLNAFARSFFFFLNKPTTVYRTNFLVLRIDNGLPHLSLHVNHKKENISSLGVSI